MKPPKQIKLLFKNLDVKVRSDFDNIVLSDSNNKLSKSEDVSSFGTRRLIMRSPITKIAAAAAVILIIAGIFIVNQDRNEVKPPPGPDITTDITMTELTPTSSLVLKYVYQQGGLGGLEEYLDKNFQTLKPQYPELSIPDILKELDNHKNERM